jgi:hypothetical protein
LNGRKIKELIDRNISFTMEFVVAERNFQEKYITKKAAYNEKIFRNKLAAERILTQAQLLKDTKDLISQTILGWSPSTLKNKKDVRLSCRNPLMADPGTVLCS